MRQPFVSIREGGVLPGTQLLALARAIFARGASFRFTASGGSMSPFIRDGDLITIRPLSNLQLHLGDIVAFTHPCRGRLVVHRIIGLRRDACLLRGDGASQPDGWVPQARVLGGLSEVERRGRRIRTGLGPGRRAVAILLRLGLLRVLTAPVRFILCLGKTHA